MPISDPGERDRYLVIQQLTPGTGKSGRPTETWSTLRDTWAMKADLSASERMRVGLAAPSGLAASAMTRWVIPYSDDMDPESIDVPKTRRLLYRNRVYDITAASFQGGGFDDIELTTIARTVNDAG